MPTVYFSFAVLISFTVYSLIEKTKKNLRVPLGILFLVSILIYHYPYFQNTNSDFNKPFTTMVKVPKHVTEFGEMVSKTDTQEKVMKEADIKYNKSYEGFSIAEKKEEAPALPSAEQNSGTPEDPQSKAENSAEHDGD